MTAARTAALEEDKADDDASSDRLKTGGAWRGWRWCASIGHPVAFGIHTLHIGHVIAPLER
jgi:hypothetical protein